MNLNPEKLHLSKWTAVTPQNKEKHFVVTRVIKDDTGRVQDVEIEAVLTQNTRQLAWRELKDASQWLMGWQ